MNNWFNVKVKYTKQLDNGTFKRVSEQYLFAAMSFTDAEARAFEELGTFIRGEFSVLAITRADFQDVFGFFDEPAMWYQVKVQYASMDDEGNLTKKVTNKFLIQGNSIDDATNATKESISGLMVDFQIVSVVESPIFDVYPYKENLDKEISLTMIENVMQEANGLNGIPSHSGEKGEMGVDGSNDEIETSIGVPSAFDDNKSEY